MTDRDGRPSEHPDHADDVRREGGAPRPEQGWSAERRDDLGVGGPEPVVEFGAVDAPAVGEPDGRGDAGTHAPESEGGLRIPPPGGEGTSDDAVGGARADLPAEGRHDHDGDRHDGGTGRYDGDGRDGGAGHHDHDASPAEPARAPGDQGGPSIADLAAGGAGAGAGAAAAAAGDGRSRAPYGGDPHESDARQDGGDALPEADVDGEIVSTERRDHDGRPSDRHDDAGRDDLVRDGTGRDGAGHDRTDADRTDADRTAADRTATERLDDGDGRVGGLAPGVGGAALAGGGAALGAAASDGRRPLHDDDALRAAEAHQGASATDGRDARDGARSEAARADRHDGDRDGDGRHDAPRRDDAAGPRVAPWSTGAAGAAGAGAGAAAGATGGHQAAAGASGAGTGAYPLVREDNPDRSTVRRQTMLAQRERFSGMKAGSGLLGWFAATGFGVVVFALFAAVLGTVAGSQGSGSGQAGPAGWLRDNGDAVGLAVAIAVGAIVLLGYFVGGYVASRMARFSGVKQGLAVWLWGLVVSVVLVVVALVAGSDAPAGFGARGDMGAPITGNGVLDAVIVGLVLLVLALVGALLGGLAGQRYHRRVDRFEPEEWPEA